MSGAYEVARDPDAFEYGPHVFVTEAWKSSRKIKQKKCAERVSLERTVDGEVNIYDVGGYVPLGKKASLLGSAERVGEGARMAFKREATILLSVFTTEMGLRLAGVYAGPRCWLKLDGFLGRRCNMAELKVSGGEVGRSESISCTTRRKIGWAMSFSVCKLGREFH